MIHERVEIETKLSWGRDWFTRHERVGYDLSFPYFTKGRGGITCCAFMGLLPPSHVSEDNPRTVLLA